MADANITALKRCPRCGETKTLDCFGIDKKRSCGRRTWCKPCHAASNKRWRDRFPEKSKAACANWQRNNKDKAEAKRRRFMQRKPNYYAEKIAAYRREHPDRVRESKRARRLLNKMNPAERLNHRMRRAIRRSLGGSKGFVSTFDLLDYSVVELQNHIERQFVSGMDWKSFLRGEIHIDHIVPLSSFKFKTPFDVEFRRAWALTNLRPLWAKDNVHKNAKRIFLI